MLDSFSRVPWRLLAVLRTGYAIQGIISRVT